MRGRRRLGGGSEGLTPRPEIGQLSVDGVDDYSGVGPVNSSYGVNEANTVERPAAWVVVMSAIDENIRGAVRLVFFVGSPEDFHKRFYFF